MANCMGLLFLSLSVRITWLTLVILQDLNSRNLQNENHEDEVPSAPPFCGSAHEIRESAELAVGEHNDTSSASINNGPNEIKFTSGVQWHDSAENKNSDQFVRFA